MAAFLRGVDGLDADEHAVVSALRSILLAISVREAGVVPSADARKGVSI